ncbi:XTP/dITP diphosphatase [Anaeromicropila herbilytica]|uniref:dITP/XTP pyrophosphatase n=1 Tax=Anaeromicropila herbilytica TaxID=2785025 RepID=A0A7R7ICA8_9FIRM|nr:XTP/dITP diphosphatase [Anaeromicropila herbilytica]BCN29676.1 non-canonical purine NTP pyrophosphatase [Anaeromicropila herbilytica]
MKKIIFATTNEGKLKEIRMILQDLNVEILSLKDLNCNIKIVEDGKTFEENSIIKAKTIMELTNEIVMADDSGLEIEYFNNDPGIYSARYLGEDTPYSYKNQYIIDKLEGVEEDKRAARFVCSIACAFPNGKVLTTQGVMNGRIAYKINGENGFGYDPIFYLPEYQCTSAEISVEEKNKISHRAIALDKMKEELKNTFSRE